MTIATSATYICDCEELFAYRYRTVVKQEMAKTVRQLRRLLVGDGASHPYGGGVIDKSCLRLSVLLPDEGCLLWHALSRS